MDSQTVSSREYRDFEPTTNIVREEDFDTIVFSLPGFQKDQLRVQLTSDRTLKISGERYTGDNKWIRFQKVLPISTNCDTSKITAKFEQKNGVGMLYLRQPKLITAVVNSDEEKSENETQNLEKNENETQPPIPQTTALKKGFNQRNETKGGEKVEDGDKAESNYDTADDDDGAQKSQKEKEKVRKEDVENYKNGYRKRLYKPENGEFLRGRVKMVKNVAKMISAFMAVLSAIVLGIYVKNLFAPVENYEN